MGTQVGDSQDRIHDVPDRVGSASAARCTRECGLRVNTCLHTPRRQSESQTGQVRRIIERGAQERVESRQPGVERLSPDAQSDRGLGFTTAVRHEGIEGSHEIGRVLGVESDHVTELFGDELRDHGRYARAQQPLNTDIASAQNTGASSEASRDLDHLTRSADRIGDVRQPENRSRRTDRAQC